MRYIDLTGQVFGNLTVLKRAKNRGRRIYFLCRCLCGNKIEIVNDSLRSGKTKSCGCKKSEYCSSTATTHGLRYHRLYEILSGMKKRCYNSKSISYKWYGLKGISICDEWHNIEVFYKWAMKNGYDDTLTIDRLDPTGNYEPSNCEWVTREENTRRRNEYVGIKR